MGLNLGGLPGGETLNSQSTTGAVEPNSTNNINLVKGQRVDITKDNPGLDKLMVGLGWDVNTSGGADFDLDVEAIGVDANGKVSNKKNFVYFNNKKSADGAIVHNGDNLTGAGDGDDETISIQLSKVSSEIQKIIFTVTIYQAASRKQNFGQVNSAYARVVNSEDNVELCKFDLSEDYSSSISIKMAELYRHDGEWKFSALGTGSANDINGLCHEYGLS